MHDLIDGCPFLYASSSESVGQESQHLFLSHLFEAGWAMQARAPFWRVNLNTAVATCAMQKRSAYEFVLDAVNASFNGNDSPSLAPLTP